MKKPTKPLTGFDRLSRRRVLTTAAGAVAAGAAAWAGGPLSAGESARRKAARKGRIKQSIVHWCFADYWDMEKTAHIAQELGCVSIELIDSKYFPILKEHGLQCAIGQIDMAPDAPFVKGFNNREYWPQVMKATRNTIDACAEFGFKNVICFTGMAGGIPRDEGADTCVAGLKKMVRYAEDKDITLCLEILNTRDDTHPMKGHPGYQGDHTEYCIDIIKRVGSPNLKLLFDIYHVQIMDGDVIRRLHQHKDYIGHVHVAGNPGRNEPDDDQEINFPAVMRALVEIGYEGYVGQEFIPTRDPLNSLRQAVELCDV
jgi:hydroxypyruvate isomerase